MSQQEALGQFFKCTLPETDLKARAFHLKLKTKPFGRLFSEIPNRFRIGVFQEHSSGREQFPQFTIRSFCLLPIGGNEEDVVCIPKDANRITLFSPGSVQEVSQVKLQGNRTQRASLFDSPELG